MDPFIKFMNDCNYSYIRQFHGKLMEGSVDIPWKIHERFRGFSMEPSMDFPWNLPCISRVMCCMTVRMAGLQLWKFHGKPIEGFLSIPWKMYGRFHRCSMERQWSFPRIFHGICQVVQYLAKIQWYSPWVFHGVLAIWICHGFSMVIPWNYDAMGSPWIIHGYPWRNHGEFIWPKTHGKLMDFSHEIFMGYFCKGMCKCNRPITDYWHLGYSGRLSRQNLC